MSAALRIRAITWTDFLIRIRKSSTAVMFLILCIVAYMWIPDPSTGRALLQMKEQRALYNSPALALATASLCAILLGLIGYYLVSNSISRDTRTRTGFVIASTTVRNYEYLTGIFLGNVLFLLTVVFGFLISCVIMQLVRGEAPVQLSQFFWHYGILLPPMIVFVSAIAVLFESIRWLSGRFGDLLYFFVWLFTLAMVAITTEKAPDQAWTRFVDTFSFGFMLEQVKEITQTDAISIGSTTYDTNKPPFVFPGLGFHPKWIVPRIVATLYPLLFVAASLLFFARFNPMKVKTSQLSARTNWIRRANSVVRPLTIPFFRITGFSAGTGFLNAVLQDVLLTLQLQPLSVLVLMVSVVASAVATPEGLRQNVLPAIFVAVSMLVADLPIREKRTGTTSMMESLPLVKRHFVWLKFGSGTVLIMLFIFVALVRLVFHDPSSALSLLIGGIFIVSTGVGLGMISGNPKTFMVSFLLFLYVVMNDSGKTTYFDFAGWYGVATPAIQFLYASSAAAMIASSFAIHRWRSC